MENAPLADTDRIRRIAVDLFEKADPESIDRAAQLIKTASEADNQTAQAAKYAQEEKKLKDDLSEEAKERRSREERRAYITSFSPVIATVLSTLALSATLFLQYFQYKSQREQASAASRLQIESATDQRNSAARSLELQTQAAEDVRWNEAIKILTNDTRLSPAEALLSTFSQSPRYKTPARSMAEILLLKSKSVQDFTTDFNDVFTPLSWDNIGYSLEIDRDLTAIRSPLAIQAVDEKNVFHADRLRGQAPLFYLCDGELTFISTKIGPLLRTPRPSTVEAVDLTYVSIWDTDLRNADLHGAILSGAGIEFDNLRDVDLSQITKWSNAQFYGSAWWEARIISPGLLEYLQVEPHSKYEAKMAYGPSHVAVAQDDYDRELQRLKQASSIR